jgi:tetratricopeptide (TPR) repeat protein
MYLNKNHVMKTFFLATLLLTSLTLPLLAQEQILEINSDPPGCVVFLDRKLKGQTPLRLSGLSPGTHLLRVAHGEKYHPYTENVVFQSGTELKRNVQMIRRTSTSLEAGVKALKAGQIELGQSMLEEAIKGRPIQPKAYWWLGRLAYERGENERALNHFKEYAQVYPDESEVHLYLAELHIREGRLGSAVTSYKIALLKTQYLSEALAETPPATWEAIKALGEPSSPEEQLKLAYLHELKGQFPEALAWLKRAATVVFSSWPEPAIQRS